MDSPHELAKIHEKSGPVCALAHTKKAQKLHDVAIEEAQGRDVAILIALVVVELVPAACPEDEYGADQPLGRADATSTMMHVEHTCAADPERAPCSDHKCWSAIPGR